MRAVHVFAWRFALVSAFFVVACSVYTEDLLDVSPGSGGGSTVVTSASTGGQGGGTDGCTNGVKPDFSIAIWIVYTLEHAPHSLSIFGVFLVLAFVSEGLIQRTQGNRHPSGSEPDGTSD